MAATMAAPCKTTSSHEHEMIFTIWLIGLPISEITMVTARQMMKSKLMQLLEQVLNNKIYLAAQCNKEQCAIQHNTQQKQFHHTKGCKAKFDLAAGSNKFKTRCNIY
jgi:beta-lactamase regulating signal transducer with metallopeptidase domain